MRVDPDETKRRFREMSQDEFLRIRRSDLTPDAQIVYDAEVTARASDHIDVERSQDRSSELAGTAALGAASEHPTGDISPNVDPEGAVSTAGETRTKALNILKTIALCVGGVALWGLVQAVVADAGLPLSQSATELIACALIVVVLVYRGTRKGVPKRR